MNKDFIPYEQALELKELGFNEESFNRFYTKPKCKMFGIDEKGRTYPIKNIPKKLYTIGECCVLNEDNVIIAPLYQQAFRWFRKNHGLYSSIVPKKSYPDNYVSGVEWYVTICGGDGVEIGPDGTYTYEEAELACLNKLIEIVKQPKKD
jgi:hypothetical protein